MLYLEYVKCGHMRFLLITGKGCAMKGFADIHTHILPGVDDGAADLEQALQMVRMAYQEGTRALFLTPHYQGTYFNGTKQSMETAFSEFSQTVAAEVPQMQVYLGSELCFEVELTEKLQRREACTLGNSRYILLEFPFELLRFQMISGITELVRCGYVPIIAHVERCGIFYQYPGLIDEVLKAGALLQLNADSVMGKQGFWVKRFCHKLLKARKVHFIASDTHNTTTRPPCLKKCYDRVCKRYGHQYAQNIFMGNVQAIVENRPLRGDDYGTAK